MRALVLATALLLASGPARAWTVSVAPGEAQLALDAAAPGDTVVLEAGVHRGPLRVERAVTLRGEPGAVVDGGGSSTVLVLPAGASGARIEDLSIRGSGNRVLTVDAGLRVSQAQGVTLARLVFQDVLYGIYGERSNGLRIADCSLRGRVKPGDETGGGNGIHLWYTRDVVARRDTVARFLDGIYLSFAEGTHIERSVAERCGRYGLHTMYCPSGRLLDSRLSHNVAGCAIMFSNHLLVARNEFSHNRGSRTYGVLLRDCSDGEFVGNRLLDNTIAVFMDNSNRNLLHSNLIQDNGWGVLLFSSCDGNTFTGNAFVNDDYPVALDMRYSDNHFDDGRRGNYWSEHAAYDLNGDGVGDAPFTPVSAFAFLSKQYPDLAILAKSPAVAALSVSERVLPALRPSEIVDGFPLARAPRFAGKSARAEPAPPADWPAAAAFALLAGLSVAGLAWGGRS